jgi:hypothetical protein
MPLVATTRTTVTQFIGIGLAEFDTSMPHGFIGDDDPALRQKLLDIAKTERETKIEPDAMTDNFRREAKPFVIGSSDGCSHEAILAHGSTTVPS